MIPSRLFQHSLLSLCFLNNRNFHKETRAASLTVTMGSTPFGNPSKYPFIYPYLLKCKRVLFTTTQEDILYVQVTCTQSKTLSKGVMD